MPAFALELENLWSAILPLLDHVLTSRFEPYGSDAARCAPCEPGKYKAAAGSQPCTSCPANSFSGCVGLAHLHFRRAKCLPQINRHI